MILFSHPAPTPSVQHSAAALARAGLLSEFWTISGTKPRRIERRACVTEANHAGGTAAAHPLDGGEPRDSLESDQTIDNDPTALPSADAAHALDRKMRARLSRGSFDAVYAYEHCAEATFRAAEKRQLLRIYDVPLGNWRGSHPILIEEAAREPEWAATLGPITGTPTWYAKTQAELSSADLVFVGSSFGLETLEDTSDLPGAIAVAPPGAPVNPCAPAERQRNASSTDTLRVLYAGPLSQRSGLSYAFRACRGLGSSVALTIIAPPPVVPCPPLRRELDRVRWLATASMEVVRQEMGAADVFLVPAVYDTNSDLLLRALAAGLPVIATHHSAARDLIRDGKEGYLVPVRSVEAIAAKLELLRADPDLRAEMARQAHRRAEECTWRRYEDILVASVATALAHAGCSVAV